MGLEPMSSAVHFGLKHCRNLLDPVRGNVRNMWYGLDEKPIPVEEAEKLFTDKRRQVGLTKFHRRGKSYEVSTVHLVLDHSWIENDLPMIYETMIFSDDPRWESDVYARYPFKGIAKAGHKLAIGEVLESLKRKPKPTYKYKRRRQ